MHYWTAFVLGLGIFFMNVEVEVWKTIDGYEDYQVSNLGRVKSLIKHNGINERILKAGVNSRGYLSVVLQKNSKSKSFRVHVLVAMMFHSHKPDGTHKVVVDHIDNNKLNNRADNLQLITNRENASKDRKGGTSKYVGVQFDKERKKWKSYIYFINRHIFIGRFETEIEASNAYNKALNQINEGVDLRILYPKYRNRTNKYEGVYFHKSSNRWEVYLGKKYLGTFKSELEGQQFKINYINQKNENKDENYESTP